MALIPLFQELLNEASIIEPDEQRQRRAMLRKDLAPLLAGLPALRRGVAKLEQQISESAELRDNYKSMIGEIEEIVIVNETGTVSELDRLLEAFMQRRQAA